MTTPKTGKVYSLTQKGKEGREKERKIQKDREKEWDRTRKREREARRERKKTIGFTAWGNLSNYVVYEKPAKVFHLASDRVKSNILFIIPNTVFSQHYSKINKYVLNT